MVANTFVKTPTALADLFLECFISEDERLSAYESRLRISFNNRLSSMSSGLDILESRIRNLVDSRISSQGHRLDRIMDAVRMGSMRLLDKAESRLSLVEEKIRVTNPANILRRGYVLPLDGRGVRMTGSSGSREGDIVQMLFLDGRLKCRVEETLPPQEDLFMDENE
jgi:exodeoxyribonuclease VII large subunit